MTVFTIKNQPTFQHWRDLADYWQISAIAKQRLEWLIFYHSVGHQNALLTATYFNINPKTFHKWKTRFNPKRIQSLEDQPKTPHHLRTWTITAEEEIRVVALRTNHLKYGKQKLKRLYWHHHHTSISTWKIERIIRKHHLYPDPQEHKKQAKKKHRHHQNPRVRIHQVKDILATAPPGNVWHTDSITIWWYGQRRVIFTALEDKTKLGFARVYLNSTSRCAADFLKRLVYLSEAKITVIHHDNGSEFAKEFEKACQQLAIRQVYSRVRQPKDNPCLERFNWTVQDEWLSLSEVGLDDVHEANLDLTLWLVEYNQYRPHQSLDYLSPLEYAQQNYFNVLPMWSASTKN